MLSPGTHAPAFVRPPICGLPFDSEALLGSNAIALVFLRYAGSSQTRTTAIELNTIFPDLDQADVKLVAVIDGGSIAVRDLVPRFHLLYPVLHDEAGELYGAFDVGHDRAFLRTLTNPAAARRYFSGFGAGHGWMDGALSRLQAAVIIGRGGEVRWSWQGRGVLDRLDVDGFAREALAAAPSK